MDKRRYEFSVGDSDYVLWAWKGDYINLGAGAELGIYQRKTVLGFKTGQWDSQPERAMPMTLRLSYTNGKNIFSTNRGYLIQEDEETTRVFKVQHEDDEVEKELTTIVDLGGTVEDVFVYHKVYGVLRAEMNIKSRMDIRNYMEEIRSGKSSLLKNVTSGYHYHTVRAERVEILDMIQEELQEKGLLAKLQDYEPVDFWGQNNYNE